MSALVLDETRTLIDELLAELRIGVPGSPLELALDCRRRAADEVARDHQRRHTGDVGRGHRGSLVAAGREAVDRGDEHRAAPIVCGHPHAGSK